LRAAARASGRPFPGASRSRSRSSRLHLPGLAALALLACGPAHLQAPAPERILLVTIDTLRADHVGCYGAERAGTRSLDALAAGGVRFEAAVSPAPLTLPAHASLMTALDPPGHGVRHNAIFRLPSAIPTLAERLKDAGYATGAVVGSLVLDRRYGLDRGFDVYDDRFDAKPGAAVGWPERRADAVVDAALAQLDRLGPRFFLWVHFYDPHMAYDPPPGFASAFATRPYAGEIAFADAQLGRLLEALRARFGEQGTLVVATSDHGESFGEHGDETHSYLVYETTQRIPLLIAGPGIPAGKSVAAPVGLVDVAPTILALAHARPLEGSAGRDLSTLIGGGDEPQREAYFETLAPQLDLGWSPLLGLRAGNLKYIRAPRPELYDLAADPGERRSLAQERPEQAAALAASLDARLRASSQRTASPLSVSEAQRQQLAQLGYLAPEGAASGIELGRVGGADPKDHVGVLAEIRLAEIDMALGRHAAALARLRALGNQGPGVDALRAAAALNAGAAAEAERDARAALAAAPGRSDVRIVLANALDAQGRRDEALRELRRLPPDAALEVAAALRLAEAEAADGELDTALRRLERAFAHHPQDVQAARAYGLMLARAGRESEALAAFEAALVLAPGQIALQNDVAWTLARLHQDLDRALALASQAAAASEGDASVLDTLALVQLARGDAAQALAVTERALPRADAQVRPHLEYMRAEALFTLGRAAEARRALDAALAAPPGRDADWRDSAVALRAKLDS
jgi:arylsulfatase A-like enzyme/Flp pilus assembly protein TadD